MSAFNIIAAVSKNNGIGKNNQIPWKLTADLKYFSELTSTVRDTNKTNAVIMGRKTYYSIPEINRPLKNRLNFVLTRNKDLIFPNNVIVNDNLASAFNTIKNQYKDKIETIWIIGGSSLYDEAINLPQCNHLYVTRINKHYDCDAFFPVINELNYEIIEHSSEYLANNLSYSFVIYRNKQK